MRAGGSGVIASLFTCFESASRATCFPREASRGRSSGAEQGPFKPRVVGSNPTGLTQSG